MDSGVKLGLGDLLGQIRNLPVSAGTVQRMATVLGDDWDDFGQIGHLMTAGIMGRDLQVLRKRELTTSALLREDIETLSDLFRRKKFSLFALVARLASLFAVVRFFARRSFFAPR